MIDRMADDDRLWRTTTGYAGRQRILVLWQTVKTQMNDAGYNLKKMYFFL